LEPSTVKRTNFASCGSNRSSFAFTITGERSGGETTG
jgi:hypothetical protein